MKNMKKQFVELLNIYAVSGQEKPVRDYLIPIMGKQMDIVKVDEKGNLLCEKKIGTGRGATVLLSAHMDTVRNVSPDRKLIEKKSIFSTDKGALGADDRAGIAIILTVLRNLTKLSFDGVVKVAFSVEEEIGVIGASKIDVNWLSDVDLALVIDRRGNRDIVAGCGMPFCSDEVGDFLEDCGRLVDMDWKCVEGGMSDAMAFAEASVNAVNLSAGYYNEHTDREYASIFDMRDTVRFVMQVFAVINNFYEGFGEVPKNENRWVKSWYKGESKYYNYNYFEDSFGQDLWAEEWDSNGDVFVYEIGKDVIIQQGDNEIALSRESLRGLMGQLKNL